MASLIFVARSWWPLSLIVGLYLLANLAASVSTSVRHGWRYLPLLPLTFAILHLSYGFGFLLGLIWFIGRWNDKDHQAPSLTHDLRKRSLPPAD